MPRSFRILSTIVLGFTSLTALAADSPETKFTLPSQTQIPGFTLQPGSYSIRVIGQLSDRVILQIDSTTGNVHCDFIGVPNAGIQKPSAPGIVDWNSSGENKSYLRGWLRPGSSSVLEFVYPKADAVAIAKLNQDKVPAIDPASEGRVADPTLSKSDMKLVTLWLLSATRVGPGDTAPAIKAERYEKAPLVRPKPVIATLPHTGSYMPLVCLLSICALLAATLIRIIRLRPANV